MDKYPLRSVLKCRPEAMGFTKEALCKCSLIQVEIR